MKGTNKTIGGGGFHHVAIRSGNFEKSVQFYTEVLGFKEKIRWGEGDSRGIMLDTGDGNYIEIFANGTKESKGEGSWFHIAIRTDNTDAATARVRAAGYEITIEPKDVVIPSKPEGTPIRISFFKGPDGETLEFFQNEKT